MAQATKRSIKAVQINTEDALGGAANLTYMLHKNLLDLGISSKMLVGKTHTGDPDVTAPARLGPISMRAEYRLRRYTSLDLWRLFPFHWLNREPLASADIVNLHNLHGHYFNYLALPLLTSKKLTCWSLHDMWALTGLCAYSYDCERWKTGCYACPLRDVTVEGRPLMEPSPTPVDRTRAVWHLKRRLYRHSHLTVVAGSQWMKRQVEASILAQAGPVVHIPDGTNLDIFHPPTPEERLQIRHALGIPPEARVILFYSSATPRKGVHLSIEVLNRLHLSPDPHVISIGWKHAPFEGLDKRYPLHVLDYVKDDVERNRYHAAADVFLMPTMADNLSLAMLDTLASGLPMVAFNTGGIPEAVKHLETGYVAAHLDLDDMANGLRRVLEDSGLRAKLRDNARQLAEREFSLTLQASRYADLYADILERHAKESL